MGIRQERVESEITRALSEILPSLKDPRISGMITVISVRVTKDFSFADVILSIYGAKDKNEVLDAVVRSAGHIRHELKRYIGSIHTLPQLRFSCDDSQSKIDRINEILEKLNSEKN